MAIRIVVLHGPNLNLLSDRGRKLPVLDAALKAKAFSLGAEVRIVQSNHEGSLIDVLQEEAESMSGLIVNAGSLAPVAFALAETVRLVAKPTVEVLLDTPQKHRSAIADAAELTLTGKGFDGYVQALEWLANRLGSRKSVKSIGNAPKKVDVQESRTEQVVLPKSVAKSIGRKKEEPKEAAKQPGAKSIGRGAQRPSVTNAGSLSRSAVREKIAERLSGKLSPSGLATWARAQWQELQRGMPVESGHRDQLEDVLQTLLLSASNKANDHQLIELMTQLT